MKLTIKNEAGEIAKVYEAETVKLKWKVIKQFIGMIDIEKIENDEEIGKMALEFMQSGTLEDLLKNTFTGITLQEIEGLDVFEDLIPVFKEMVMYAFQKIKGLPKGN